MVERIIAVCYVELGTRRRQLACEVHAGTVRAIPRPNHRLSDRHRDRFLTVARWSLNCDGYVGMWPIVITSSHLHSQLLPDSLTIETPLLKK